ncbi:MAG: hypothetical protein A2Y01_08440 [Omnitrophica WOR_2 bacterium GWC2_44_8]|nr:MAG: hypothetical protein A2Y01_08440 [Omnitrophica WOR_2 bacterium GWC2_44_8]
MISSAYSAEKVVSCGNGHFRMSIHDGTYQLHEGAYGEFKFYQKIAKESGGPVLDLATGGGRICITLAKAGITCVGMDASPHSLVIAKKAVAELPQELRGKASFIEGDMCDFNFPGRFPLIINAFESFWFILRMAAIKDLGINEYEWWLGNEQQKDNEVFMLIYQKAESCIRSIMRSLAPRGKFIIDGPISHLLFQEEKKEVAHAWWLDMADTYKFSVRFADYNDLNKSVFDLNALHRPDVVIGQKI